MRRRTAGREHAAREARDLPWHRGATRRQLSPPKRIQDQVVRQSEFEKPTARANSVSVALVAECLAGIAWAGIAWAGRGARRPRERIVVRVVQDRETRRIQVQLLQYVVRGACTRPPGPPIMQRVPLLGAAAGHAGHARATGQSSQEPGRWRPWPSPTPRWPSGGAPPRFTAPLLRFGSALCVVTLIKAALRGAWLRRGSDATAATPRGRWGWAAGPNAVARRRVPPDGDWRRISPRRTAGRMRGDAVARFVKAHGQAARQSPARDGTGLKQCRCNVMNIALSIWGVKTHQSDIESRR